MSALVERSMGELNEDRRQVYPLFQKGPKTQIQPKTELVPEPKQDSNVSKKPTPPNKKRASRSGKKAKNAAAAQSPLPPTGTASDDENAELLEVDPNTSRRKRQKTNSPEFRATSTSELVQNGESGSRYPRRQGKEVLALGNVPGNFDIDPEEGAAIQSGQPSDTDNPSVTEVTTTTTSTLTSTSQIPIAILEGDQGKATEGKTKKVLRFNPKTGTIGSPPAKKSAPATPANEAPASRPKRGRPPKSLIVKISYGKDEEQQSMISDKINQILSRERYTKAVPVLSVIPPVMVKKLPSKPLHPLFLGKAAKANQKDSGRENVTSNQVVDLTQLPTTPTKARQRFFDKRPPSQIPSHPLEGPSSTGLSQFTGFGAPSKLLKFPGALEPAWPWKGMVHIRGESTQLSTSDESSSDPILQSRSKKSKGHAAEIHGREDILKEFAASLNIALLQKELQLVDPDEQCIPPACLRAPSKHNESGHKLQKRIRKELVNKMLLERLVTSDSEDEISGRKKERVSVHPALSKTYSSIATSLSAFDEGACETQAWIQKHSPKCTAEVLQTGREAFILKEWLQTLTVKSVEAGLSSKSTGHKKPASKEPKPEGAGKRKRKPKLDGFIIDSGDEDDDMDEISEPEEDSLFFLTSKKTVVRVGDLKGSAKMKNAVVVSGPSGVGKSAAVYAVAKELGFEVFEINSSTRRSGKDILEKVGDMTRNHLVQGADRGPSGEVGDEDKRRLDDAVTEDLKSGRQGTVNSFFKAKLSTKPKPKFNKVDPVPTMPAEDVGIPKARSKDQKQSLILIEEADVLFKEDTQFWATIINLILTSKRPVILTCNDEGPLPMNELSLHAIIRMNPAPAELAADYLILVAACEGHIVKHDAAKTLYQNRGFDLRASLTDLNFWCQFAVADPKGVLNWYPDRSRPGNDIDKSGNKLRVISEGTYQTGMGCLSQDFLESHLHYLDIEEEMLHEVYDSWNLDAGDWEEHLNLESWAQKMVETRDKRAGLEIYSNFAEYMSASDLCSGDLFAPDNKITRDASLPEMPAKALDDYTLSYKVIEGGPVIRHTTLSKDLAIFMRSRVRNFLQVDQHVAHGFEVPTELARYSESHLLNLIREKVTSALDNLTRHDFSLAFDPISEEDKPKYVWTAPPTTLVASSFDRNFAPIFEDLAPYVRGIVAYDKRLAEGRKLKSGLLSQGGRPNKRMRTTRAAMSALEGGERKSTRKERWFGDKLNPVLVERTGKPEWIEAAVVVELEARGTMANKSRESSVGSEKDSSSEKDELS